MKMEAEMVQALTKELTDKGKLIEAGWIGLRLTAFGPGMTDKQLAALRDCFFAGAQHLMAAIMSIMDEDEEPTENDLNRMDMIHRELMVFFEDFKKRHNITDED